MYINILFALIMIAAIVVIAKHDTLSKSVKGFVIMMLLLALGSAVVFEYATSQSEKRYRHIVTAFKEGKSLECSGKIISNKTYSYEPGTATFLPLSQVVGDTYARRECKPQ